MTTENQAPSVPSEEEIKIDQFALLKQRANMLGITFSNNISPETLKAKIDAKMAELEKAEAKQEPKEEVNALTGEAPRNDEGKSPAQLRAEARQRLFEEQSKLIRLNITNLNPRKQDLMGEYFTVANDIIGTQKKFVPYTGEAAEAWHVPNWIYQQMLAREFQQIKVRKNKANGQDIVETKFVKEFALEVLPPLSKDELAKLAAAQKASGSLTAS